MDDEYHGETEELSDSESDSEDEEADDMSPLKNQRSPSKRKGERRSSLLPQKKTKVTFASIEFREQIFFFLSFFFFLLFF